MKTALVFAAHGDDETTIGGTIKKLSLSSEWKVHAIIGTLEVGNIKRSEYETEAATNILGCSYEILDFRNWINDRRKLINIYDPCRWEFDSKRFYLLVQSNSSLYELYFNNLEHMDKLFINHLQDVLSVIS